MEANVTVYESALSDRRIEMLAKLLGVDVDSAGFKMVRLWSVMTKLQTDTPSAALIRVCLLNEQGEDALVRSGLGVRLEDGVVRVRGRFDNTTGKDRLEWYGALHERNVRGGLARAANADRDGRGRFAPTADPPPDPPASPASPEEDPREDLISSSSRPELPDSGTIFSAEREGSQLELVPEANEKPLSIPPTSGGPIASKPHGQQRSQLWNEAWSYAAMKFFELRAAGINTNAQNSWALPSENSFEARELYKRIDELVIKHKNDVPQIRAQLRNRVDVAAAKARLKFNHLRFLTPARVWDEKWFAEDAALTPEQVEEEVATRATPSARTTKPAEPIRLIPKL